MKVLYIDTAITGHHLVYLKALRDCVDEVVMVLPEHVDELDCRQHVVNCSFNRTKSLNEYLRWIWEIHRIIQKEKPDFVHFLYGDAFYRFFGFGLRAITRRVKTAAFFHQIRRGRLRDIGIRRCARCFDKTIVHTQSLLRVLYEMKINNGFHIECPQFSNTVAIPKASALEQLGIAEKKGKVLLALGGTREDKGLDVLLDALKYVKEPFHLIVAGQEQTFKKGFIEAESSIYKEKVSLVLRFLTDEDFSACLNIADIIVLPYRKIFTGASGPLGEGVALNKMIIGANHGSVGDLIDTYHLGMTFEAENPESLAFCVRAALQSDWMPDEKYYEYQSLLSPVRFKAECKNLYVNLLMSGTKG